MEKIKKLVNMEYGFEVRSKDYSGGLVMLWMKEASIDINSFSDGHIDATIDP